MELSAANIPAFDCKTDAATLGPQWRRWKRAFDYYMLAKGVEQPAHKKPLLSHFAGFDVQGIFETLDVPDGGEYVKAATVLDNYFQPRTNVTCFANSRNATPKELTSSSLDYVSKRTSATLRARRMPTSETNISTNVSQLSPALQFTTTFKQLPQFPPERQL